MQPRTGPKVPRTEGLPYLWVLAKRTHIAGMQTNMEANKRREGYGMKVKRERQGGRGLEKPRAGAGESDRRRAPSASSQALGSAERQAAGGLIYWDQAEEKTAEE